MDTFYQELPFKTADNLPALLKKEVSGRLLKLLTYRLLDKKHFVCDTLDSAMDGFGCNESLLTETLAVIQYHLCVPHPLLTAQCALRVPSA